jgi:hypothetical protein
MLDDIAGLKCKVVKNSSQHQDLLFTMAENSAKFPCSACKIG